MIMFLVIGTIRDLEDPKVDSLFAVTRKDFSMCKAPVSNLKIDFSRLTTIFVSNARSDGIPIQSSRI